MMYTYYRFCISLSGLEEAFVFIPSIPVPHVYVHPHAFLVFEEYASKDEQ